MTIKGQGNICREKYQKSKENFANESISALQHASLNVN